MCRKNAHTGIDAPTKSMSERKKEKITRKPEIYYLNKKYYII